MNTLCKSFSRGLMSSLNKHFKAQNITTPIYYRFSEQQSKTFVMKKSELSNELLISLSMGFEHKEATNQKELTDNLIINNVLKSQIVQDSFKEIDRDLFAINKNQKIYANNPLSIGKGQNMTSPLMHAIALQEIYERLQILIKDKRGSEIKILDIGCGRGFIAFALAKIIEKSEDLKNLKIFIKGIDIYEELTNGAQEIQKNLNFNKNIRFEFSNVNIESEIQSKEHVYDIIHTGVALEKDVYKNVISSIYAEKQNGACFLCPVIQEDLEQDLILRKNDTEHLIMKCVYTQMTTLKQQEVSKYFLNDGEIAEEETSSEPQKKDNSSEQAELEENTKMVRDLHKYEQQLKTYETNLKSFYDQFKQQNKGASPTLKDLNNDSKVKILLNELQQLKRNIKYTKNKLQQSKV